MPTHSLRRIPVYILLMMFVMPGGSAQETRNVPSTFTIPDGTPIRLRLAGNISSSYARIGDLISFMVVKDVSLNGFTVIQAGTMAHGSISKVRHRRLLGIGGNVSLKLNSAELANGDQIGLRGSVEVKGRSRTALMAAAMIATSIVFLPAAPVFLFTRGHNSIVVKTTEIIVQVDGARSVPLDTLRHSRGAFSELGDTMNYLPPRVFTGEGRESDIVNLIFLAKPGDLQQAFQRAGWVETDKRKPAIIWHLLRHGNKDTKLPMARFYLFGRVQDYSYALPDPNSVVSRRHHLRIWKTDSKVDGTPIWAGAATHDIAIEVAKRGHLIAHRIDPEVDVERDFIGTNLTDTLLVSRQEYLHCGGPVFEAQTATGETYHSDGRILFLDLQPATSTHGGVPRQTSIFLGETLRSVLAPSKSLGSSLTSPH